MANYGKTFLVLIALIMMLLCISAVFSSISKATGYIAIETTAIKTTYCKSCNFSLSAYGGNGNYSWEIIEGQLPTGLKLEQGDIKGFPTIISNEEITVKATDSNGCTTQQQITVSVVPEPLKITTDEKLPVGINGNYYSTRLNAEGGSGNYRWKIVQGKLPKNILLDEYGMIMGDTKKSGIYCFTAECTDKNDTAQKEFIISIMPNEDDFSEIDQIISEPITIPDKTILDDKSHLIAEINGEKVTRKRLDQMEKECRDFMDSMPKTFDIEPRKVRIAGFKSEKQKISYIKSVQELSGIKYRFENSEINSESISATKNAIQIHKTEVTELYLAFKSLEKRK